VSTKNVKGKKGPSGLYDAATVTYGLKSSLQQTHPLHQFLHLSKSLFSDWNQVAYPFQGELQPQKDLDQHFVKVRFVSEDLLPYVTVAVSYNLSGPYFPMTFFVDTGTPKNYIKRSTSDVMHTLKENVFSGTSELYIGDKKFEFYKPIAQQIHDNVHQLNILGTSCLYESPYIADALLSAIKLHKDEKKILMEKGRGTPPDFNDLL